MLLIWELAKRLVYRMEFTQRPHLGQRLRLFGQASKIAFSLNASPVFLGLAHKICDICRGRLRKFIRRHRNVAHSFSPQILLH